jgi:hypothetical protein
MPRTLTPVLLILALACRSDKPEDRVKKAFSRAQAAVEAGDATGAVEVLSPDFRGPEDLDKASANFVLMGLFREGRIGVTVLHNEVAPEGAGMLQEVELLLTQKGSGLLPQDAGRKHYLLHWTKREGEWRLRRLEEVR